MRIYMLGAKGFPAASVQGGGGVERHVEEIAIHLAARGHQVFVYVRNHWADPRVTKFKGVHIIRLPSIRTKNLDTITHVFLSTLHVLFQPADIVHYHGIGPATLSWITRLFKWRSRTVVTFHSRDRFDPKWSWFARSYLAYGEWASLHYPHETIVVSHILQVYCRRLFGRDATYIPNGAELPGRVGSEALASFGLKSGRYFLGVGRLVPNKAYDVLIEAFAKVETDFQLAIVGDAEYASEHAQKLEALAAKDGRVKLLGFQTGRALDQLFGNAYAFVHPSRSEGLSTAVIEAMAHRQLVIMSDIAENRELVDHSGVVFPVDNRAKLAEALRWALTDPAMVRERGARAREVVERRYSWDHVVDLLELTYRKLF